MVGGLVQRYDSGGEGGVHFRHITKGGGGGGGELLSRRGEVPYMKGQLYDLLNSERFTLIITTSEI